MIGKKVRQIKIEAPAKINLTLEVLGKREDGYHNIRTVLQTISLYDKLTLREIKKGITVHMSKAKVSSHIKWTSNLAYRAAELFLKETGIKKGVEIYLEKNIPIGAGLGGGSSDAAGVLLGLNKLWKVGFTKDALKKMAIQIGMDVPFFIDGGSAYATGRGEIVHKISPYPSFWILLIDPGFQISTKWAYSHIDNNLLLTKSHSYAKIMIDAVKKGNIEKIAGSLFNIFEELIKEKYPNFLEDIKHKLKDVGAIGTLMTGSGPAVFGIVKGRGDAYKGWKVLSRSRKEKVYLVKTIGGECRDGNY